MTPEQNNHRDNRQSGKSDQNASLSPYSQEALARIQLSDTAKDALKVLGQQYGVDPARLENLFKQHYVFMQIMAKSGMKVDSSDATILKDIEIGLKQGPIGPRS
jgi:hypothetical protein